MGVRLPGFHHREHEYDDARRKPSGRVVNLSIDDTVRIAGKNGEFLKIPATAIVEMLTPKNLAEKSDA